MSQQRVHIFILVCIINNSFLAECIFICTSLSEIKFSRENAEIELFIMSENEQNPIATKQSSHKQIHFL